MNIDFNKGDGLVPVIIQNVQTMQVLMLGYMNKEAFDQTIETKKVTFYSRSKRRLWMKGESSGNTLSVIDVKMDCDQDSLLICQSKRSYLSYRVNILFLRKKRQRDLYTNWRKPSTTGSIQRIQNHIRMSSIKKGSIRLLKKSVKRPLSSLLRRKIQMMSYSKMKLQIYCITY